MVWVSAMSYTFTKEVYERIRKGHLKESTDVHLHTHNSKKEEHRENVQKKKNIVIIMGFVEDTWS